MADAAWVALATPIVVAAAGRVATWRPPGRQHASVLRDIELHDRLPAASEVKTEMSAYIDDSVRRMITNDRELRRDPTGIVLAVGMLLGSIYLFALALSHDGPARYGSAFGAVLAALFGSVGLSMDAPKRRRDERGRVIK